MMIECDIMRNNKGQALVEFIIILPIFLLLLISIIDFGNIILKKYSLESDLDTVYDMYKANDYESIDNYLTDKKIYISYSNEDEFTNIILKKDIKLMSPLVVSVFGDKYEIKAIKSIYKNE